MSLLKVHSKRGTSRSLTLDVPSRANSYLTIYSLAVGIPKGQIVRELIEDWLSRQPDDLSIANKLVERIKREWKIQKSLKPIDIVQNHKDFLKYIESIEDELRHKGVEEQHIEMIIEGVTHDGKN